MFYYFDNDVHSFICSIIALVMHKLLSVPLLRYRCAHFYLFYYYVPHARTFIWFIITLLMRALLSVPLLRY